MNNLAHENHSMPSETCISPGDTINRGTLLGMGYRIKSGGYPDTDGNLWIHQLEAIGGRNIPDFCYCEDASGDRGFIIPAPFGSWEEHMRRWKQ